MPFKEIAIVVAHDQNRLIGDKQQLPWHLPADLKHFKRLTWGHAIIMGRKTFASIGRPLPGRLNIVVSRTTQKPNSLPDHNNLMVNRSLEEALACTARQIQPGNQSINTEKAFIIGGQQIYEQSLKLCCKLYVTRIQASFSGDAYFPAYDLQDWRLISSESGEHQGLGHEFLIYERI